MALQRALAQCRQESSQIWQDVSVARGQGPAGAWGMKPEGPCPRVTRMSTSSRRRY